MTEALTSEKHQCILDAAQQRFARYGLAKVTMDEIAQDLGMGKASLYYYFPTKESIYKEVITREQNRFIEQMAALLREPRPAGAKLRLYLERRWVYLNELLNLSAINVHTIHQMKPLFGDLYQRFGQRERALIQQILDEGRETGEFAVADSCQTAAVILNMLRGLRFYYFKTTDALTVGSPEYQKLCADVALMTEIILHGITAPAQK
ncbi:TetR family transcriptional regulator [Hydrogenispora ethanolica]|uniref:TetR family transcriptional regulator n=1 Tax=Hydrogenispora ethanolica TaxID=1082276 RepID=A0A4R1RUG8_HYDET|nr:TetR/AcrR family transcriptional regulator [Hydrogenispora ethanolica]TCL70116.1 TetR family transcriptional regulator [Hydrogenispora ethanolica]